MMDDNYDVVGLTLLPSIQLWPEYTVLYLVLVPVPGDVLAWHTLGRSYSLRKPTGTLWKRQKNDFPVPPSYIRPYLLGRSLSYPHPRPRTGSCQYWDVDWDISYTPVLVVSLSTSKNGCETTINQSYQLNTTRNKPIRLVVPMMINVQYGAYSRA